VLLALCAATVLACFFLQRPELSYEGQTIAEWFKRYSAARLSDSAQSPAPAEKAFQALGTNAVPFLVRRINQTQGYTRLSLLRAKYHRHIPEFLGPLLPSYPGQRFMQGMDAAELLATQVKPPGRLLLPLLATALQSSNASQRVMAFAALRGIRSDYEMAQAHLARGLKDPDIRVQEFAAMAIRWHGPHGTWAVTNLLETARTTNLSRLQFSLQALNGLGSNALPIVPRLVEMRDQETDDNRRQVISEAIDYISKAQ
jgi:hypothetical protein